MNFIKDPQTGNPSVSLTLLLISFLGVLVGGSLQIAGKTQTVSVLLEVFYSCTALYFGRRLAVSGKTFSSGPPDNPLNP